MNNDVVHILGANGPLSDSIEGFAPREAQQQLAQAIDETLHNEGVLVAEAGTGIGKTYAYLVPSILSGKKVIISTGTRPLQDQLYHRDLPKILSLLGVPIKRALLKGRTNYLCTNRLSVADVPYTDKPMQAQLALIKKWAKTTKTGDLAELKELPENAPILFKVCSTIDFCSGNEMCNADTCFAMHARKEAQDADLVVVNHHLFLADMALKDGGFGEVLPEADAFIFDEAHQLPEVASNFFGNAITGRNLLDLTKDVRSARLLEAQEADNLPSLVDALDKASRDFRLSFGTQEQRQSWQPMLGNTRVAPAFSTLKQALEALAEELVEWESHGPGLSSCMTRCVEYINTLKKFENMDDEYVYWLETSRLGYSLNQTPLSVAKLFSQHMNRYDAAWVFTSATLTVNNQFTHFLHALGLYEPTTLQLDSPFDYPNNSIICLPDNLPEPNTPNFDRAVLNAAVPILEASQGRAFMLFTSHRALRQAADILEDETDFPLFVQGDSPRSQLLDEFRVSGNGVLLGTSSFWEGVDIKGDALSCVIIDKLPFAAPNDPVLQARMDTLKEQGRNPFIDYQLPNAVIALKQGVGRLIRDVEDRGVVVICDVRLKTKFYGKQFVNSLPPMKRTRKLSDIQAFFS